MYYTNAFYYLVLVVQALSEPTKISYILHRQNPNYYRVALHNSSVWTATLSLFDEKKEKRKMASSSRDRGSNTCDEETGMTSGTPVTTVETSSGPGNRTRTSRFTTTTTTTTTSTGRRVNISGES